MTPRRTALVTGAARGIGRAVAARLAADGYAVTACDLEGDRLHAALPGLREHGEVRPLVADVTDLVAMTGWLGAQERPLDVLVNNAALAPRIPTDDLDDDALGRVLRVNFQAAALLAREAGRGMRAAGRGSIVNVASVNALRGQPDMLHYNASKAALAATRCGWRTRASARAAEPPASGADLGRTMAEVVRRCL